MSSTEKNTELNDAVTRFTTALQDFSLGKGELKELQELRNEVVRRVQNVPGIFLVTPSGGLIWTRLLTTGQDRDTAEGIAADLAKVLQTGGGPSDYLKFIDDAFIVFLEGKEFPPLKPLAYAILKVLYVWRGNYVTKEKLFQYIDDEGIVSGRCREKYPVIENNVAGQQLVKLALRSLPPPLRRLIKGDIKGRIISKI